jgi:hypothetical protein
MPPSRAPALPGLRGVNDATLTSAEDATTVESKMAVELKPIVGFATSALNELADDEHSSPLCAGLTAAFFVRLTETNIGEIAATQDAVRRRRLLDLCKRLLRAGECISPYHWIIEKLISAHRKNPASFDWTAMDVRLPEAERELLLEESIDFDDELASEQRAHLRRQNQEFSKLFTNVRPEFEKLFDEKPEERPESFSELVRRLQSPGGESWAYGKALCQRVAKVEVNEAALLHARNR